MNKDNTVCFYHNQDLDGHCSAAIVKKYAEENNIKFKSFGWNYGDELDFCQKDFENSIAVIVDITPPIDDFREMTNHYDSVIWIDHHKSAIEEISKADFHHKLYGLQKIGQAACELTWQFFFNTDLPLPVLLLGRYDVWDKEHDFWSNVILPFQYGMRLNQKKNLEDDEIDWTNLLNVKHHDNVEDFNIMKSIIETGNICLKFEKNEFEQMANDSYYESEFEDYSAVVINHAGKGSHIFDSVYDEDKHDIMISWKYQPDKNWSIGLYSTHDNVDCSIIAKKYGGGGHKGASGFQTKENPLELFHKK